MTRLLLATAALATATILATAPSQAGTRLGLLTCQSDGSLAYVVGSSKDYLCVFTTPDGASEPYVATLDTVGVDVGITGRQDLSWVVYAGSFDPGAPATIGGNYYGVSADAAVAAGGGAKILAGGPENGFTLQPTSLQAQFGLNATLGVSRLSLTPSSVEPVSGGVYKN